MRWAFHTIPHPGEMGYNTWPPEAWKINGGANAWAGLSVDPKLGMVFAATGSASFDFYGANRHGDNLFADCVIALDARTGKRVWHFQGVKHDLWDLDFPAAPSLVTVTRNGKSVEAVAQIAKTGFVFVLDRKTGAPLFPIEYRKVPASTLDGEKAAETQPYPVKPPAFTRQTFTEDTNRTPEAHAAVLDWLRKLDSKGMFTPPSTRGTVLMPGTDGGAEWGGAAFDPGTGLLYVNSNEQPWIIRMVTHDTTSLYNNNCANCHKADRTGTPPTFPSLVGIGDRRSRQELITYINEGAGRMPGFSHLGRGVGEIVDFLLTGKDTGAVDLTAAAKDPNFQKYRNEGYILMRADARSRRLSAADAALGNAECDRSQQGRDPVADSFGGVSGTGVEGNPGYGKRQLWRPRGHEERAVVHRGNQLRQEIPGFRQTDGKAAVGNGAAGCGQCDALGVRNRRPGVCVDRVRGRQERRALGQQHCGICPTGKEIGEHS